ncbi:hypothetical protein [Brachybacterium paraconglomeratum]|uniref:hypothetical protein n=1 Tax=Brachybacterium paraconglomeratum TaxID=173362 RepID=UPI0035145C9E
MTDLLATLTLPVIVAAVTAVLTSWLGAKRSAADRVAELRMRSYTDALVAAHDLLTMLQEISSGDELPEDDEIKHAFDKLRERLQLLSIVASTRADKQVSDAYSVMNDAIGGIESGAPEELRKEVGRASERVVDLVMLLTEVARKDVRRTRA